MKLAILNNHFEVTDDLITLFPDIFYSEHLLLDIVKSGHGDQVKFIIDKGVVACNPTDQGSELNIAAQNSSLDIAQILCEQAIKINLDLNSVNKDGETALFIAVKKGDAELTKVLCNQVENKLDLNRLNNAGWGALHVAAEHGFIKIVEIFCETAIKNGLDICVVNNNNHTPLHLAAEHGRTEVVKLLCSYGELIGFNVNAVNINGENVLFSAVKNGRTEVVSQLCDQFEDKLELNKRNNGGWSALHVAAEYGYVEIVKILCETAIKNKLDLSVVNNHCTPLHLAAGHGRTEVVKLLCFYNNEIGIDVNAVNSQGLTAFYLATQHNRVENVKFFCENAKELKLDANTLDSNGLSVLTTAITNNQADILQILCDEAKNIDLNVNLRNPKNGITPLVLAIKNGSIPFAKMLLDAKADINMSVDNLTPLELAIQHSDFDMIKLLVEYGANLDILDKVYDSKMITFISEQLPDAKKPSTMYLERALALESKLEKSNIWTEGKLTPDALLISIKSGRADIVEAAIKKGAKCSKNGSELYTAVTNGHYDIVEILFKNAKKINLTTAEVYNNENYKTALEVIVINGDAKMVKLLCRHAEVIGLRLFNPKDAFRQAVEWHYLEIIELLFKHAGELKLDINEGDVDHCNVLHTVKNPQTAKYLCQIGMDLNAVHEYGGTPLGEAIKDGNYEVAKVLLEYRADINKETMDFMTAIYYSPLETAIRKPDFKMVKLLLEYGAKIENLNFIDNAEMKSFVKIQLLSQHIKTFPWKPKRLDLASQHEKYIEAQSLDAKTDWNLVLENVMEMAEKSMKSNFSAQSFTHFSRSDEFHQLKIYLDCFSSSEKLESVLCDLQYVFNKPTM